MSRKFLTLFSLLFGLGVAVQLMRAEARGADAVPLYVRRLGVLLAIGIAHATLLWWGDILRFYAVLGLALLPFRRASSRTLLVTGLALATVGWPLLGALADRIAGAWLARVPPRASAYAETLAIFSSRGYADVVRRTPSTTRSSWRTSGTCRSSSSPASCSGSGRGGGGCSTSPSATGRCSVFVGGPGPRPGRQLPLRSARVGLALPDVRPAPADARGRAGVSAAAAQRSLDSTSVPAADSMPPIPLTSDRRAPGTWRGPHSPRSWRTASMIGKMPYMPVWV